MHKCIQKHNYIYSFISSQIYGFNEMDHIPNNGMYFAQIHLSKREQTNANANANTNRNIRNKNIYLSTKYIVTN